MPKNVTQDDVTQAPAIDLSKLSVAELTAILSKVRQEEKAKKAQETTLPMFAFVMVKPDSTLVYWSGRAADDPTARKLALAHAGEVFKDTSGVEAITPRPLPGPRGRKAKTQEVAVSE